MIKINLASRGWVEGEPAVVCCGTSDVPVVGDLSPAPVAPWRFRSCGSSSRSNGRPLNADGACPGRRCPDRHMPKARPGRVGHRSVGSNRSTKPDRRTDKGHDASRWRAAAPSAGRARRTGLGSADVGTPDVAAISVIKHLPSLRTKQDGSHGQSPLGTAPATMIGRRDGREAACTQVELSPLSSPRRVESGSDRNASMVS